MRGGRCDIQWRERFDGAEVGDTVMTPTNVQATVTAVHGPNAYDTVIVVERTLSAYTNRWRQNQLIVQRRAYEDSPEYRAYLARLGSLTLDEIAEGRA